MQTSFKKADIAILALVLCLALALFALPLLRPTASGAHLVVSYADGREQAYPLSRDTTLPLTYNGHSLTVQIEAGTVRVTESSCPDGLCRALAISRGGETLVCAPAGIALTIQTRGGDVDAIIG